MQSLAQALVVVAGLYAALGLVFAVPFVLRGVERVDPTAHGSGWGFRLIIVPGVIALWPLLLRRWAARTEPPRERNAHRDAARETR